MSEKELFSKLGADEKPFGEYLRSLRKDKEAEVFAQEVSPGELAAVAGGTVSDGSDESLKDGPWYHCTETYFRYIYIMRYDPERIDFPNCAATVEDGSWCGTNDACYQEAVSYLGMKDCAKAWH